MYCLKYLWHYIEHVFLAHYRVHAQMISSTISSPKMAFEYRLTWLEQPAEKVKFREQAHTYKCQNQELLLGRVGTFWICYFSCRIFNTASSAAQCVEGCWDRTLQESWHYGIGCQTL
jgi:hypothetical protein